ncbi:SH3 domain-containing protein [Xanthomonas sp. 3075]|uniref:SH3 domain-containing protein n=1 Tax=Xanthomonas sp. 3075 TaxID=3035315 RepID=UPI0016132263|nr:SH3 domain-containing protein [Xanthomonas sp. 3075]MBB4132447.1 uncharacterized protein YraI [Xanthomonas sp. 3075]
MKRRPSLTVLWLMLVAAPAAAQHAGHASSLAGLRAGPAEEYRRVGEVQPGGALKVYGCFNNRQWCDVRSADARGWMPAQAIALNGGVATRVVPSVGFSLDAYWNAHYSGRDWTIESERALWREHTPGSAPELEILAPGEGLPAMGKPSIARRTKAETRADSERIQRDRAETERAKQEGAKRERAEQAERECIDKARAEQNVRGRGPVSEASATACRKASY